MPYLEATFRNEIDRQCQVVETEHYLASLDDQNWAGAINYLNSRYVKQIIAIKGQKYFRFCLWVGTMILCVLEGWRRVVVGYEDKKIQENGDVF